MRVDFWLGALIGLANASALIPRDPQTYSDDNQGDYSGASTSSAAWRPKTHTPDFFSLKFDESCDDRKRADCELSNLGIKLEDNIVIATPYNKWWSAHLPIFFIDDDTQAYTVSKTPMQLYVDTQTGALKYQEIGWLPPNSIAISFYRLGTNPLGKVAPSSSYFSWPTTEGRANFISQRTWWFCPLSGTGQYQVFVSGDNFGQSVEGGVEKSPNCISQSLAAINANPWGSQYDDSS